MSKVVWVIFAFLIIIPSAIIIYVSQPGFFGSEKIIVPKQIFIFIQDGQWIAVKPNMITLAETGIYMTGLNFTSSNFTTIEQWAINQTKEVNP
jgi:hypothetical protein